ncbi:biotin/lipoyl-containing protein, partial [Actinophytocola sp.]|uniref:biotin/lipoyl-containing protein n=1 Tax=Actinophytocola sp. TaxID=1872138 RepID=UPI003D6B8EF9
MAFSVQMPALGESVTEGTVTRWLKQVGDPVEVDEPLLEVSTDKVDTEIPSPAAGVLQKIVAQEDETIEVGAELAVIGESAASGDGGGGGGAGGDTGGGAAQAEPAPEPAPEPAAAPEPTPQPTPQPAAEPTAAEQPEPVPAPAEESTSDSGGAADGTPVTMPALGESVTEGTVTRWLKQVGDPVEVDEPLLEVSTDKVDTEIPSPVAGTVLEITAAEDETVQVGGQLAVVGTGAAAPARPEQPKPAEKAPEPAAPRQEAPRQEAPRQETPQPQAPAARQEAPVRANGETPYVTPLVRKLAAEQDVDLSRVQGSGVGGRIRKQDVLAAAEAARQPAPAAPAA